MIPALSSAIGPMGAGQWSVGSIGSIGSIGAAGSPTGLGGPAGPGPSSGFGGALTDAINSLDKTQATATSAAQGLATGTLTDPTQAVTAVENASLSMDLAAQIRDKLTAAESTIFQTQV